MNEPSKLDATTEEGRATFIQMLRSVGLTSSDAHIVFDMMQQAKEEVFKKVKEVSMRAPSHLQSLIMYSTFDAITSGREKIESSLEQGTVLAIMRATVLKDAG